MNSMPSMKIAVRGIAAAVRADMPVEPKGASCWPIEPRPRRTVMEPGVPAWTPGMSCASWTKLRPLSGRSTILRGIDDGADGGRFGLQQRGRGFDVDGLGDFADLQNEIDARCLLHLQGDTLHASGLKARHCTAVTV